MYHIHILPYNYLGFKTVLLYGPGWLHIQDPLFPASRELGLQNTTPGSSLYFKAPRTDNV